MHPMRTFVRAAAAAVALTLGQAALALPAPGVFRYDSGSFDEGNAVASDAAGNVYLAGALRGSSTQSAFGVVKFDRAGARQWVAQYSGTVSGQLGRATAVAVDAGGNVYAAGSILTPVGFARPTDLLLVKFAPSGAELWSRRVPAAAATRVAVDARGDVVVAGTPNFLVQKYDSAGALRWQQQLDSAIGLDDLLNDLVLDAAGNVHVTGWSDNNQGPRGATDFATAKFSADGVRQWQRYFSDTEASDEEAWDLALDGQGNVYVTGETTGDTSGELAVFGVTVRYDGTTGAEQFVRRGDTYGGRALTVDVAGAVTVGGNATRPHVARLDPQGNLLWVSPECAFSSVLRRGLVVDGSGSVLVASGLQLTQLAGSTGAVVDSYRFPSAAASFRDSASELQLGASGALHLSGTAYASSLQSSGDALVLRFGGSAEPPAPVVPTAPSNLGAAATARQVTLAWRDNAGNETGYAVERCARNNCSNFVAIAQLAANASSHVDGTVVANVQYRYRVRAFNAAGPSGYSNTVDVRTPR